MPKYRSRSRSRKERERKRVRAQIPRDKRKLAHWAVRGTHKDYDKLRKHVGSVRPDAPSYIHPGALDRLQTATRRSMLQNIDEETRNDHFYTDGLAWAIDKVPRGAGFDWMKKLGQAALKPFRGDSLSEVDEQYARLTDQSYTDYEGVPADAFEGWQRQPEFDSNYLTVWDNDDGHRFVAVRGTKPNVSDVYQDLKIAQTGAPDNLVGADLRRVLDHTEPSRIVDVGSHSLGTSLLLTAFEHDDTMQDRIHESRLYNPAYSPFAKNVTGKYEADNRVRYFIDLMDPVSIGDLGEKGPKNVVYRREWNPLHVHSLVQWGGTSGTMHQHDEGAGGKEEEHQSSNKAELPQDLDHDGVPDVPVDLGHDYKLDFGESFDNAGWSVYWNT